MKKAIISVIAVALILSLFSVNSFAYNAVVADNANLFSVNEIYSIEEAVNNFCSETAFSLAVVTTNDAEGKTSEEYADDFYDDLIFNEDWSENGLVFLIDMDNREVYISTAGECITAYSDYVIDYIIDSGYNHLTDGYYAECILSMIETAKIEIENYSGDGYYILNGDDYSYGDNEFAGGIVEFDDKIFQITPDGEWEEIVEYHYYPIDDYEYNYSGKQSLTLSSLLFYIFISLVIAAIAVLIVKSRYKNMGKGDEFNEDDITLVLTGSNDSIISRNVVTTRIPKNNNHHNRPGGGSFGGGSSVHRSGGGISHGGGGRKF